jgi:hypothetical protein
MTKKASTRPEILTRGSIFCKIYCPNFRFRAGILAKFKLSESLYSKLELRFRFSVQFYPRKYIHSKNYDFKFWNVRKVHLEKYEGYDQYQSNLGDDNVCT